jgi:hypothetical protein
MKTSTLKSMLAIVVVLLISTQAFAQTYTSTRIDVRGSRYSDQVWVFATSGTTRGFDNGYDAGKMFGTSTLLPQIFGWEEAGFFQIDAVPDMNNTYIGFKAGEDTTYTFTFNNEYLNLKYTQLFLVDSVANKTVDVYTTGTTYTFNVQPTATPVKRFKLITSLPVVPPVVPPTDTVVVTPPPVVVIPPAPAPVITLSFASTTKVITINNTSTTKGTLTIYNSATGKTVQTASFIANGKTTVTTKLTKGTYVAKAVASTLNASLTIVVSR